ncbi:DUF4158 domain-containing protein [Streptomyces sp. ISL-43]|uniref:DUF4158 domain-containing protein n=1 Tax=Streptomyces sp. ISL-43 TaxID=2819183 RepID=UPI001BEB6CAF|nr:DUF4158 domain-containing protein [Streptomyces sp. ISL-43]MBT2453046.1 DUF4158 domain-containing protein [Streptomyces sp. ISL-43]
MLKSYQRMGCFPALEDVPEMVVDFVRRQVELPEGTLPAYRADRTAKHHRGLVRKRVGVTYDQARARRIVEQSIRKEAAAKNRPADLINIALEKVVEAGLELAGFSTFDKMASKIRTEVNASICAGIHDRMWGDGGDDDHVRPRPYEGQRRRAPGGAAVGDENVAAAHRAAPTQALGWSAPSRPGPRGRPGRAGRR